MDGCGHVTSRLSVKRRPKGGRPRSTTAHQDCQITLLSKWNRMSYAVTLNRDFRAVSSVLISTQTFRNRLHASGLHAKKLSTRPPLTAHHRNRRLQLQSFMFIGYPCIRPVPFTDEFRFWLDFNNGRRRCRT
jgi:hypothetical protein